MQFIYYKTPGTVMYGTLHCNHTSLVGIDKDKPIDCFIRAAPEGADWYDYSCTGASSPGFTPYYLTDAIEIGTGDVVNGLDGGTYSVTVKSTDFHETSLTLPPKKALMWSWRASPSTTPKAGPR